MDRLCYKCGKNMADDDGEVFPGFSIKVNKGSPKKDIFLKRQMGKYDLDREYEFCWECFIDALSGRGTNWIY